MQPGQTVAQYEILEVLGRGGMGVVYRARDTKLDRIVALEFLPAHLSADHGSKRRFIQEAKAASALWARCDPELAPEREEIQARLDRIRGG